MIVYWMFNKSGVHRTRRASWQSECMGEEGISYESKKTKSNEMKRNL
jgi:hypothetical protein